MDLDNPQFGQLMPVERVKLYQIVRHFKPAIVLEVGTWRGAGSTLQIARALHDSEHGHLHTCEPDQGFFDFAKNLYDNAGRQYRSRLTLHHLPSNVLIAQLLAAGIVPDMIFFDGPETANTALDDLKTLEPHLRAGCVFGMHDWLNPESTKCDLIRPYIETSANWHIVELLSPPISVGLVFAQFSA